MRNIINREYEVNEGIFVLQNALTPLYDKYRYTLPREIKEQFKRLIDDLESLIVNDDIADEYDIIKDTLILKLRYKKFIPEVEKGEEESKK